MIKRLLLTACYALCVFFAFAQETTSEIQGTVSESKGILGGATVTALHVPTGTKYTTTTRKDGRFNLPNIRVGGPYTLTVSYIGYKEEKQENITLLLGQEFKADFTLTTQSKELTEVIVATSRQGKIFNSGHTGSQEIINRAQIERLPTVNRSWQDFTRLTPSSNGLNMGGRSNQYNNVTVDGANFNNAFGLSSTLGGQSAAQPISLDAIEQIQVSLSPYDVRQGGFSGAGINSVTRGGTNQFKGSVYTYYKSADLQGYHIENANIPKQNFNYNLAGASFGGAFIPNKLFFFVSGEIERRKDPATSIVASTNSLAPNNTTVSNANYDTLNTLKDFLVKKYAYDPGQFQGYTYRTQSNKLTVRIDWNINEKNTLTLKYNYLKSFKDIAPSNSGSPTGGRQPSSTGLPFSGAGYTINNNFNIFIAELNTRLSNKASNKLQIGYTALRDFRSSQGGKDFPLVDILNGAGKDYTSFGYEPFTYNNVLNTDVYQLSDNFTFYKGKHEITIGTQNYYKKFKNGFAPNYEGAFRFNTLADFYSSANNGVGNSVRYALQYSAEPNGVFPFARIGAYELGFFAQDKWRVQQNFTLTYGFRVDVPIFENKFEANPNAKNLVFRDGKSYDVGQKPGTNLLISPRLGFNWDVTGDSKTQIRGGIGTFSGPPPFVWISNQASNNGVQFGSDLFTKPSDLATRPFNPDINAYRHTGQATSYNLVFTDQKFKYPQVLKTTLGIDQKLPGDLIGTVEFTYSKDINAVNFENVNLPSSGTPLTGPDNRTRLDAALNQVATAQQTPTNPNITNAILMKNYAKGYAYNLTFQLQRNFRNLYTSVAYTYSQSKSLNDGGSISQSSWAGRPTSGDPNAPELGYTNFYQPHRVVAYASYRFEYAHYFATSVGLIFEAAAPAAPPGVGGQGVGSYVYNGDINNNGSGVNMNLMYIPRTAGEVLLVPVNSGPLNSGNATLDHSDTRTAGQIWAQLDNFINQDHYLAFHRGQIAQRNAAILPYYKRLDLNVTQDFYYYTGHTEKTRHTLRLTFDIVNVGNLLNRNWGVWKTFNNLTPLTYEGLNAQGQPLYSMPYQDAKNQLPYTNPYKNDVSNALSHWQAQIGIRYLFN